MAFGGRAFYLAGDSYPADRAMEDKLCARLCPTLPHFVTQAEWWGRGGGRPGLAARRERLEACIGDDRDVVLIGRSSGARLATLVPGVRAVICLGYPFQAPSKVLEVGRFAHLATIAVPTLILQGTEDEYGGADLTERFGLSSCVQLRLLPEVGHKFRLSRAGWDAVTALIVAFIEASDRPPAPDVGSFDEGDYLARHPDVAAAVASGAVASGHAHYLRDGRREGRRFRVVPLSGLFAPP